MDVGYGFPESETAKGMEKDYAFVVSGRLGSMPRYYYNNIQVLKNIISIGRTIMQSQHGHRMYRTTA